MMQPSVWTSYLIDQSPEEMIETFAERDWPRLEMSDEHAQALLDRGNPARVGAETRAFAAERGVSFPQGHLWLASDLAASEGACVLDTLRRWLDLFVALGIRAAVLHPGGNELIAAGTPAQRVHEIRVERLRILCDHIGGTGTAICLENIVRQAPEADDLLRIIADVGRPNLGICLDTGHLNMTSGDQAGFIAAAGKHLLATHIADNEGQSDQHMMPYGRGTVNWSEVMPALGSIGYDGLLNLEIPGENRCPLEVRLAKLDYLRTVMDHLMALASASA